MTARSDAVIWPGPPKWSRGSLLKKLRKSLRGKVESAFLFGSHAAGTATSLSDLDLILVARTAEPWPKRGLKYLDLLEEYVDVDVIVYTPGEWKTLQESPTKFLEHARKSWKKIL